MLASHGLVPGVEKVGVLHAGGLGDYLFTLPALAALRAAYPSAELVLLGAAWHARELGGRPGPIDRFLVAPALPGVRTPEPGEEATADELLEAARAERFDLALQLHGGGRNSNPLVRRLGARTTAGLRASDAPGLDRWVRYVYYQQEVFRYLEAVSLVGATPVTVVPSFEVTAADRADAAAVAGEPAPPRIALHPGASDSRRRWPPSRFAAVGDELAAAGNDIVLTGTPGERAILDEVRRGMRHPARPLVGALSLGGLAGLYAGCALVIANDTGPLHLAAAVGAATVGIFWVGNLINGAPLTRGRHRPIASWTIHCPRCGEDCTRDAYPSRPGEGCDHRDPFVTDVPVAEVLEAAADLLGAGAAARPSSPTAAIGVGNSARISSGNGNWTL